MLLSFAELNQEYPILRIKGKDAIRTRLQHLGIFENGTIVVRQKIQGNAIVEVQGTRIALDSELCKRIIV